MSESHEKIVEHYVAELNATYDVLSKIEFSDLIRPAVPYKSPPTPPHIEWAIRVYCFSLISQFRDLLRSALTLIDAEQISAVFVVARSIYELGAHCYYTKKHVMQYLDAGDLAATWTLLLEINTGSRYMQERGDVESPTSPHISKVIKCYNEYMKSKEWPEAASISHSFLSEATHPNCAAFINHFEFIEESGSGNGVKVIFRPPSCDVLSQVLPEVAIAVMTLFHCGNQLLVRAGESDVASQLLGGIDLLLSFQRKASAPG